jgi:predicted nucleotidyltransferase
MAFIGLLRRVLAAVVRSRKESSVLPLSPVPTGIAAVDTVVARLARELGDAFPGEIHSLYLFGSFVDGSAVSSSDIDLIVVSNAELTDDERARVQSLSPLLSDIAECHVDLLPIAADQLLRSGHWRLEANSLLVAGEDLRPHLPRETLAAYLRRYSHAPYAYMANVLRDTNRLVFPVAPPISDTEYSGYARTPERMEPGESIKAFVATVCWIATLLVGFQAGQKVASRHESSNLYHEAVGGQWASFVDDVYRLGKLAWAYRVPESADDRRRLRRLTDAMPGFENHYLAVYRSFLLDQLKDANPDAQLEAIDRLREWVVFPDDDVRETLRQLAVSTDERLRDSATKTLDAMTRVRGERRFG